MSRAGRPSERAKREPHKRNLIGPHEILERLQAVGGADEVAAALAGSKPSAATQEAGEAMLALHVRALDVVKDIGGKRVSVGDDPTRRMAWILSITTSMKESVPKKKWCRHLRAADPGHVRGERFVAGVRDTAFLQRRAEAVDGRRHALNRVGRELDNLVPEAPRPRLELVLPPPRVGVEV
jgi:hypothetical protein